MLHQKKLLKIGVAIFLISLLSLSNATATDDNDEDMPLPDYGPEKFEEIKNESWFITTRGTMPIISNDSEKQEWLESLKECILNNDKMSEYYVENGGPVESFGRNINGYLKVGLESTTPEKVNDTVIDEIYQVINQNCELEYVEDVPVVFIWSHDVESLAIDNSSTIADNDYRNKNNESSSESNTQTPGFTSIMLVLCLFVLFKVRR